MKTTAQLFAIFMSIIFNATIAHAMDIARECPISMQPYDKTLWVKKSGTDGTFVQATWLCNQAENNLGTIICTYARGNGELISKFSVIEPVSGNWRGSDCKKRCFSVANPHDCQF